MSPEIVADLNDLYTAIGALREARAIVSNTVRGTNDANHQNCKDWERIADRAQKAYNQIRTKL